MIPFYEVLKRPSFWIEVVLCLAHVPPFVTGEVANEAIGNIVVYRYETIGCAFAILRLYLCWRTLVDRFVAELPDSKMSISTYNGIKFDSFFFLKKMLNTWTAFAFIFCLWFFVVIVGGYLFRLSEITSCLLKHTAHIACNKHKAKVWSIAGQTFNKENDLHYFNAFWFISTSITPGGGGNILAATHAGRAVAALAVMTGVCIQSLTTAALGHLLLNTPAEYTALGISKREEYRILLERDAANILQLWWRKRRNPRNISKTQQRIELFGYRRRFVAAQRVVKVEVEECASMSTKIDQISRHTKSMVELMDNIAENIYHQKTD